MPINFKKFALDGEHFVNQVAAEIGVPDDPGKAGRIMRAVFRAFRDRVPPAESLEMIAQLPMMVKAIYVDGWQLNSEARNLRRLGDFFEYVREVGGPATHDDFTTDFEVAQAVRAVFRVVNKYVSWGENKDVLATLPEELRHLFAKTD